MAASFDPGQAGATLIAPLSRVADRVGVPHDGV
jgi:hypothetical protein